MHAKAIACRAGHCLTSDLIPPVKPSGDHTLLDGFVLSQGPSMIADSNNHDLLDLSSPRAWAEAWHLWTVIVPRRSITGRLVSGKVWRRYSGRHGSIRSSFQR